MNVSSALSGVLLIALLIVPVGAPRAIDREDVMIHAVEFTEHIWFSTQANQTADCSAPYTSLYLNIYGMGGPHKGLAYDWGGWDTIPLFDQKIADGYGAGSHANDGVLSCTTGQDCSGFVSRCWETPKKHGTATLHQVTTELGSIDALLPGDAMNKAGSHVVLFDSIALDGRPLFYEAAGGSVRKAWFNGTASWSYLNGYKPIRYNFISDGEITLDGSLSQPIQVSSYPYSDERNTLSYGTSNFDAYSCAPEKGELGPEVVYELTFPTPGLVTAEVGCGPGVDIDLHLLTALSPDSCIDRAHEVLGPVEVEAGTYYLVADSWSNSSGVSYPGPYSLLVEFESTGDAPPVDLSTTCTGYCDTWAPGGCGCGPDCVESGDCCEDACAVCGACPTPEGDPEPPPEEELDSEPVEEEPVEETSTEAEELDWNVSNEDEAAASTAPSAGIASFTSAEPTSGAISAAPEESSGCTTRTPESGVLGLLLCIALVWRAKTPRRRSTP